MADGSYLINGDMEIDTLNSNYNFDLPEGDYETIAGMIIDNLARIPQVNTKIEMKNYSLVINEVTRRKIEKVKLVPKQKA